MGFSTIKRYTITLQQYCGSGMIFSRSGPGARTRDTGRDCRGPRSTGRTARAARRRLPPRTRAPDARIPAWQLFRWLVPRAAVVPRRPAPALDHKLEVTGPNTKPVFLIVSDGKHWSRHDQDWTRWSVQSRNGTK